MLKNLIFDDDTRAFGEIEPGKETSLLILYDKKIIFKILLSLFKMFLLIFLFSLIV